MLKPPPKQFFLIGAYGEPKTENKVKFIQELGQLTSQAEPWLVIGDLKFILHPEEKTGETWNHTVQGKIVNAWQSARLLDLGYIGSKYTW